MSTTEALRNGDGNTVTFTFPFEYLEESDVKVSVDGLVKTQDTDYTFSSLTEITFVDPPSTGTGNVRIFRETEIDNLRTEFFAGSAIRAQDLNENFNQTLMRTQEVSDRFIDRTQAEFQNNVDLTGNKIVNLADGTDPTDAVNKQQLDASQSYNDSQLVSKVAEATTQAGIATNKASNASDFADAAEASANAANQSASDASDSADAAELQAQAAADSAIDAAAFATEATFYGITRATTSGNRVVLRVDYTEATDTTGVFDPKDYNYKGTSTSILATNGLLYKSGAQLGQPKFFIATTTSGQQTSGHVYIQLHD